MRKFDLLKESQELSVCVGLLKSGMLIIVQSEYIERSERRRPRSKNL